MCERNSREKPKDIFLRNILKLITKEIPKKNSKQAPSKIFLKRPIQVFSKALLTTSRSIIQRNGWVFKKKKTLLIPSAKSFTEFTENSSKTLPTECIDAAISQNITEIMLKITMGIYIELPTKFSKKKSQRHIN